MLDVAWQDIWVELLEIIDLAMFVDHFAFPRDMRDVINIITTMDTLAVRLSNVFEMVISQAAPEEIWP